MHLLACDKYYRDYENIRFSVHCLRENETGFI